MGMLERLFGKTEDIYEVLTPLTANETNIKNTEKKNYILRITYLDGSREDKHVVANMEQVYQDLINKGGLVLGNEIMVAGSIRKVELVNK